MVGYYTEKDTLGFPTLAYTPKTAGKEVQKLTCIAIVTVEYGNFHLESRICIHCTYMPIVLIKFTHSSENL